MFLILLEALLRPFTRLGNRISTIITKLWAQEELTVESETSEEVVCASNKIYTEYNDSGEYVFCNKIHPGFKNTIHSSINTSDDLVCGYIERDVTSLDTTEYFNCGATHEEEVKQSISEQQIQEELTILTGTFNLEVYRENSESMKYNDDVKDVFCEEFCLEDTYWEEDALVKYRQEDESAGTSNLEVYAENSESMKYNDDVKDVLCNEFCLEDTYWDEDALVKYHQEVEFTGTSNLAMYAENSDSINYNNDVKDVMGNEFCQENIYWEADAFVKYRQEDEFAGTTNPVVYVENSESMKYNDDVKDVFFNKFCQNVTYWKEDSYVEYCRKDEFADLMRRCNMNAMSYYKLSFL